MTMKRLLAQLPMRACCVAVVLLGLTIAVSPATADERSDIEMLLRPYDTFPDRAAFKRASDDPATVLLAIYDAPDSSRLLRLQSLAALGWFGDDARVEDLFSRLLDAARDEKTGSRVSHRAINAGTTALGTKALPHLAKLLQHEDVQIRLSVVYAAARLPEGRELLMAHLDKEQDDAVIEAIRRQAPVLR